MSVINANIPEIQRVSVLDDDPTVGLIISKSIEMPSANFSNIPDLKADIQSFEPLCFFIDIHLGENENALEVLPLIRETWRYTPIIVMTVDTSDDLVEKALESGANDFILKPIRPKELKARMQARLKDMNDKHLSHVLTIEDVTLDRVHRVLSGDRGKKFLTPTEARIIECLLNCQGSVVTREHLKRYCWGPVHVTDNALDRQMYGARAAIKEISDEVTVRSKYGQGYRIERVKRTRKKLDS